MSVPHYYKHIYDGTKQPTDNKRRTMLHNGHADQVSVDGFVFFIREMAIIRMTSYWAIQRGKSARRFYFQPG